MVNDECVYGAFCGDELESQLFLNGGVDGRFGIGAGGGSVAGRVELVFVGIA